MCSAEADEPQHFLDPPIDLVERRIGLLVEPVADVLPDGQRVEQRPFLEHHADVGAHLHHLELAQLIDAFAVDPHLAAVSLQQSEQDLERQRLAGAAGAQDDLGVAAAQREADVLQNHLLVEGQRHVVEGDDRLVLFGAASSRAAASVLAVCCRHRHLNTGARSAPGSRRSRPRSPRPNRRPRPPSSPCRRPACRPASAGRRDRRSSR